GVAWDSPHRLGRWARRRRSENTLAALAFDGIDRVFSNDALVPALLRGHLFGAAARLPPVAHMLWRRAAGVRAPAAPALSGSSWRLPRVTGGHRRWCPARGIRQSAPRSPVLLPG